MGGVIGCHQPGGIDAGVDLRRRERGVAEQFLDGAQIAAAAEQMRGEGMAQAVRRRRGGQAERAAQPLHRELDDARRERPALDAEKERAVGRQPPGAERDIVGDGLRPRRAAPAPCASCCPCR